MAKSLNQLVFKMHSWLGLFNGIWLLILGLTGSLLVYTMELDKWINHDILTVTPTGKRISIDSMYHIIRAKYPAAMGTTIYRIPEKPTDCISFRVYTSNPLKPMKNWYDTYFVDLNPWNGKVLREGNYRDMNKSFLFWAGDFHYSLQYGPIGSLIITIAGVLLFINMLTGIIIYRKHFLRVLVFRAPVQWKNWRTGTSGLHRYIGVWSIVFNILIFYSGLQMTWNSFDKSNYQKPAPLVYNTDNYANLDTMYQNVYKIYPGFKLRYFYIPFSKLVIDGANLGHVTAMGGIPGTPSIIPLSASAIEFDVNTGLVVNKINAIEELNRRNLWNKFNYIAYSFHAGTFLGEISRALYVVVGLAPAFLSISGFMLWWRRKGKRKPNHSIKKTRYEV